MSDDSTLGSAGFELQSALAAAVGDPIADDLDNLEAGALQRLICAHNAVDIRRFMNDHKVPARRVDLVAARRVLPNVRRDRNGRRMRTVRWLTSELSSSTHDAFVTAVGPPEAKERHLSVDLDEVIAEYSAPAVRLSVLRDWGTEVGELDLAMLIVDRRAVPDRWRPHLDRLLSIAERLVADFAEAHPNRDADLEGPFTSIPHEGHLGDEEGLVRIDFEAEDFDEDDLTEVGGAGSDDVASREAYASPGVGIGADAPPARDGHRGETPDVDADGGAGDARLGGSAVAGGHIGRVGDGRAGHEAHHDQLSVAEAAALDALDAVRAAQQHFERTLETLRRLTGGHADRLAFAESAVLGGLSDQDLAALRAFAAAPLRDDDSRFLDALAKLADLSSTGCDDTEVMLAEDAARSFAAANRFRSVIFGAARGRLVLRAPRPVDERLRPWLDSSSPSATEAPATPKRAGLADTASEVPGNAQLATGHAETSEDGAGRWVSDGPASERAEDAPAIETGTDAVSTDSGSTADMPPGGRATDVGATPGDTTPTAGGVSTGDTSATTPSPHHRSTWPAAGALPDQAETDSGGGDATTEATSSAAAWAASGPADAGAPVPAAVPDPGPVESDRLEGLHGEHGGAHLSGSFDDVFARIFAEGRWGLARWLAQALGDTPRAEALEAVAYADAARSATGALAAVLSGKLVALSPQRISGDRPAQLLAVAAATRAAVVTPFSDATTSLMQLARIFEEDAPAIAVIADAAVESARHGVAFTGDVIASLGGAAAVDSKFGEVAAEADRQLARIGRTGYSRADRIWADWVAVDGPINELLAPVAANDSTAAPAVRAAVFEHSKDSVRQQIIRDSDDRHRGPGKRRLEGPPRAALLGRLQRAIDVASAWLELQQATAARARSNDHEATVAARLRDAIRSHRTRLEATLAGWAASADPALAGAARGAERLYEATFALTEGEPLPGAEQDTSTLLDVDLLRSDIVLGPDLTPVDSASVTAEAVASAVTRSWQEAFRTRVAADDHVATAAIVAAVASNDPEAAALLAADRADALADARHRVRGRTEELSALLQAARRSGRVSEDTAADLAVRIGRAADLNRNDLGAAAAELDTVGQALEEAADAEVENFRPRLEEASAVFPAVAAAASRFHGLLAERDLATAEELLLQLQEGMTQPTEHRPSVEFADFFPAVVEYLGTGITPELIERARRREVDGPLDFRALSPEAAQTAAEALESWRTVAVGERQYRKAELLATALRALGLEFRSERGAKLPGSNDRTWIDLTGVVRVPQTLVPAFGTYAGDTQRLLLVWKQPGESLLEWVEQDASERPVLVLYFGTMNMDVRRRVVNRLRGRHARPVVIIDDAVVAWAASLGHQTFEVTMRATLPFAAVNPYEPDIAGSVPEEMFYGRVVERSAVMSEMGTSLIYGGRRLGKSALLRAAERRFSSAAGQEAIYIDLSAAGIRNTKRPEAVWDLIAARLVEQGIAERPSGRRAPVGPFERAEAAVRAWLGGGDRRLLLLLDECDDFFDVDSETDFAETRRLKNLMESTGRRFKVVFAGLHQVARFSSYPNQPFAHLGKPVPIGPLAPQYAYNLIAKPLTALGWRFESENLINRALTYCNYIPILLQVFGHTLVNHLHAGRRVAEHEPTSTITTADIEAVLNSSSLDHAIRSRFDLTLSLDPRYKMIAYVLALETGPGRSAASTATNAAALRDECREWWPEGFASVGNDEFRALLDELVDLGVLSPDRGSWRMRSPNVVRLLGTRDAIERGLMELVRENPASGGMFSGEAHRRLDLDVPGGGVTRSPFTEQQLADVIGEGRNQLRVVVGTAATGADDVPSALAASRDVLGRWELLIPNRASVFEHAVVDGPARQHRVVFSDLRGVSDDSVIRTVCAAAKRPTNPGATCSAVLLVNPASLPMAEDAVGGIGIEDDGIVPLHRYTAQSLRAWAVEVESGFTDDEARRRLAEVTGGWPVLIAEAERITQETNAYRAVAEIEASLPSRAGWLLATIGLDEGPLADAWAIVMDVLGDDKEPADALAPFLAEDEAVGAAMLRALLAAGVLVDDDGILSAEPVVTAAWQRCKSESAPA